MSQILVNWVSSGTRGHGWSRCLKVSDNTAPHMADIDNHWFCQAPAWGLSKARVGCTGWVASWEQPTLEGEMWMKSNKRQPRFHPRSADRIL